MPMWPMLIPSDTVGAPNVCGTPPAARTLAAFHRQSVEVGVAWGNVAGQGGDADDRLVEVVVLEADGPEHGPVRGPAGAGGRCQARAGRCLGHRRVRVIGGRRHKAGVGVLYIMSKKREKLRRPIRTVGRA